MNEMSESELTFFAPLEIIEKSHEHEKSGIIDIKIKGVVSDDSKDFQGDVIPQDIIDFSVWDQNYGRIKWEHGGGAKSHIGFPVKRIREGNKTIMEGRIYAVPGTPQYETAREAVGEIENIESFNKSHPESPKRVGFSLEGGIKRDKNTNKILKVVVTNVALTATPINYNTYAQMMKSLEIGAQINPADATGGEANRTQSIEGNFKIQTIRKANQMHFKSKDEYKDFLKKKGFSEEEAEEKAKEWEEGNKGFKEREDKHKEVAEECEKAFKAIDEYNETLKNGDFEKFEKSYAEAINPVKTENGDEINPAIFLKSVGDANLQYKKSLDKGMEILSKSLSSVLKGINGLNGFVKSMGDHIEDLVQDNDLLFKENESLKKSIEAVQTSVVTDPGTLKNLEKAVPDVDKKETSKFSPNEIREGLRKASMNKIENADTLLGRAEMRSFMWDKMDKSLQNNIEEILKSNK